MKLIKKYPVVLLWLLFLPFRSFSWGVWGHQHINRAAIFALPEPMRGFYFNHNDFLTLHASVPDLRKYQLGLTAEKPRHYFDVEAYGDSAFTVVPPLWQDAVAKYGKKKLYQNGILPWYLQLIMKKLTHAFKTRNKAAILLLSADLAHYVGDGFQPLHTTQNYDGQLTGQRGIHALFESRLPELFGCHYNWHTKPAVFVANVPQMAWTIVKESHENADRVLSTEKLLLNTLPKREIYVLNSVGHIRKNQYNQLYFRKSFCKTYEDSLHGLTEYLLRRAVFVTASLWYTAWVNSGRPDLSLLDDTYTHKIHRKALRQQYKEWVKKGKLMGIYSIPEFKQ